jgi:putative transposase
VDSGDRGASIRRGRFSIAQLIAILQEHAAGVTPADLMRRHGISRQTFYALKRRNGGL